MTMFLKWTAILLCLLLTPVIYIYDPSLFGEGKELKAEFHSNLEKCDADGENKIHSEKLFASYFDDLSKPLIEEIVGRNCQDASLPCIEDKLIIANQISMSFEDFNGDINRPIKIVSELLFEIRKILGNDLAVLATEELFMSTLFSYGIDKYYTGEKPVSSGSVFSCKDINYVYFAMKSDRLSAMGNFRDSFYIDRNLIDRRNSANE